MTGTEFNGGVGSIRLQYEQLGVRGYYSLHGETYSNPHFHKVEHLVKDYLIRHDIGTRILDMSCGAGEVTSILKSINKNWNIEGTDPFTYKAYERNTGNTCMGFGFKEIVCGALSDFRYDTIICSYAMHLCELSMLDTLLYQISLICDKLIIVTPHKRPYISDTYYELEDTLKYDKTTLRSYIVKNKGQGKEVSRQCQL